MEQTQSQQMRQEQRQVLRMEQADMLEMPDAEFHKLINEVEYNPLFLRLYQKEKLIRYQRFPRTDMARSFYPLKEEALAGESGADVESMLLGKESLVNEIRRIGLEKFRRYFLFPEAGMSQEEVARECGLDLSTVQKINDLVNDFSVISEFSQGANVTPVGRHYARVASIERSAEGFTIGYYSLHFARGRYAVDYESYEKLRASGTLNEVEAREAKRLLKKLELINSRKDTLTRILQGITQKQALYLESGKLQSLLPCSQKELAETLGLAPSTVSRAIFGKSVDTPWGKEMPLKDFFPKPKRFRQELLRRLLETGRFTSDEAIRTELWNRFGVAVSRRSVADLRQGLKFPAARRHHTIRNRGIL